MLLTIFKNMGVWLSRSTIFAAFFALTAYGLACKGLLSHTYVEVIIALHVTIVGRAVAEDYKDRTTIKESSHTVDTQADNKSVVSDISKVSSNDGSKDGGH
jgi:hypothetical protein